MPWTFQAREPWPRWSFPSTKLVLGGLAAAAVSACFFGLQLLVRLFAQAASLDGYLAEQTALAFTYLTSSVGFLLIACGVLWSLLMPRSARIRFFARKLLFSHRFGNPLSFKEGERLPRLRVSTAGPGAHWLTVSATAVTVEDLERAASALSSGFRGKLSGFAVTATDADVAARNVRFRIEDVTIDRTLIVDELCDLVAEDPTRLRVQHGTAIDLTTSGSILAAGKTRSGKTTGVLSLLLQVLALGPDHRGSSVVIVDPKMAELSRVPRTVTLDDAGTARPVLRAMVDYENSIKRRQRVLNDASERTGGAVKWWEASMHPSFLFLDEFVALRSLLPARAEKDDPAHCVKTFDDSLRRIITMGASAGCFVVVSIAQANAEQIPTMLRDAFSTRLLFRPTADEGALLWERAKVSVLPNRVYTPGDAWFSSTDGVHDSVSFVHFPQFTSSFAEYRELGELMQAYAASAGRPYDAAHAQLEP